MVAAEVRPANRSSCLPLRGDLRWPPLGARQVLDPVLDLAAGAVDLLVEGPGVDLGGAERGHDEARVRALGQVLAGRGIDVRAPELGREQMPAAEDVQRQIAVTVVIAVEEPALLVAMQRVVGGIEVENDLLRRHPVRLEQEGDEQAFDRRRVVADLVVAARRRRRMLETVQRAFTGEPAHNPGAWR
jgi:hypothetical protein